MKGERRAGGGYAGRTPGGKLALLLAIAVHAAFIALLIWSIRWQSRPPEVITAELYAPPVRLPRQDPLPTIEPPKPPPRFEPKAEPLPLPERRDAEIALKAKQDEEKRQRERVENEKREREKKAADEKRVAEERKKADEKKAAEAKERQDRQMDEMRAQADREAREAAARAKARAETDAKSAAQADWIRRIQAKIRGNVILPPELPGNPEAIFEVVQLPTGEIIDVQLRKPSGVRAYDEAVQRAILKSSPLPRPDRPEQFQRALTLRFRPLD
ncbi:MAG TPA: TonB C-terminal domain-containing protein [Casimicrobiaceae bacterium]|jgi:colicin import membrane protein